MASDFAALLRWQLAHLSLTLSFFLCIFSFTFPPSFILLCYRPNKLYYQAIKAIYIHSIQKDYLTSGPEEDVDQLIEYLPSMHETLCLITSII